MKLNVATWKLEDIRPTLDGMQYKVMDFSSGKNKWYSMKEIEEIAKIDLSSQTKLFASFMSKATARTEEVRKVMSQGFEKKYLKRYKDDKYFTAEIVEVHYGNIVSAPRLLKSLTFKDFYHPNPSWGIEDDIIIDAKRYGVEDIYLIDAYNDIHFITTMKRFNLLGESMSWGKTYLPLKNFDIHKYGDKVPSYEKHLKGVNVHENNTTD